MLLLAMWMNLPHRRSTIRERSAQRVKRRFHSPRFAIKVEQEILAFN
jgi:hypothetical protein